MIFFQSRHDVVVSNGQSDSIIAAELAERLAPLLYALDTEDRKINIVLGHSRRFAGISLVPELEDQKLHAIFITQFYQKSHKGQQPHQKRSQTWKMLPKCST